LSVRSAWRDGDRIRVVETAATAPGSFRLTIDGVEVEIDVQTLADGRLRLQTVGGPLVAEVTAQGEKRFVRLGALDFVIERAPAGGRSGRGAQGGGLESPMPGVVTRVDVSAGDAVRKGQPLVVLEAMKMEHVIRAPRDGKVRRVTVGAGEMVNGGIPLVEMEEGS